MMPRATCPVCGQGVATHDGRLVRHHGTQMRWSGRRWFRTTCKGSGRLVDLVEEGRLLASQREDLVVAGADPTELAVPIVPIVEHHPHCNPKCSGDSHYLEEGTL